MIPNFAARIDDDDDMDDWNTTEYRTGDVRPLRADCWFQDNPDWAPTLSSSDFSGIRINIWNRAKDNSLQLSPIPLDLSGINVHGILLRH